MSNKPYRLAQGGSRIDRTKKVHFSFDGKQLYRPLQAIHWPRLSWPMEQNYSAAVSNIIAHAA